MIQAGPEPDRTTKGMALVICLVLASVFLGKLAGGAVSREAGKPAGAEFLVHPSDRQRHEAFVAALVQEGAVTQIAPCRKADLCVTVTGLFARLRREDKARIGALLSGHYANQRRHRDQAPVIRFRLVETGQEAGRFADHRLDWYPAAVAAGD